MSESDRSWKPGMRSPGAINWLRNNYIDATAMRLFLNCDVRVQDEIRGEGTLRGLVERANDVHNGVSKQASKALMARIRRAVGWVTVQDYEAVPQLSMGSTA